MFFEDMPFRYDIDLLRVSPDAAAGAPTIPCGSPVRQWKVASKLAGTTAKLRGLAENFDRRFEKEILPAFADWVHAEKGRDLSALTTAEWLALWTERERRVMDEFAPASLLPSLITAMAVDDLKRFCAENFWDEDPEALASGLAASPQPDSTVRSAEGLHQIAQGTSTVAAWLAEFGHRAPEEFDLATPRWRERPDAVATLAGHLAGSESPLAKQEQRLAEADRLFQSLEGRLPHHLKSSLRRHVDLSRRYLRFREDGKHALMLGYDLLRDLALEAGRRLDIGPRVFLLDFEELRDALLTGFAPLHLLDGRGISRSAESRLVLPHVVTGDDIEGIGDPPSIEGGDRMAAFSISNGAATGPAKIVFSPAEAGELGEGYILVCPSTDPNWTPLFVKAAGLIIERGGTLSHGAVVAREMGLPAVVFDGATRAFKDGEQITVDAQRGAISRSAGLDATLEDLPADASDETIPPAWMPPPPGDRERRSASLRNFCLAAWAAYFVGAFLCPPGWVYEPSMRLLDLAFWPLVAHFGKPLAVAILAAGLAAACMIGQRLLTDNRRLDEAKKRAARLKLEAKKLPVNSPRAKACLRAAAPVQTRIMLASFVPLAVILGPMVMIFSWLPTRVDPASANAKPGADILVTAKVAGDFTNPIRIDVEPPLTLADGEAATKTLPPIRATLEKLQAKWRLPSEPPPGLPWDILAAGAKTREEMLADLGTYLKSPLPPQELAWTLKSPPDAVGRFGISVVSRNETPLKMFAIFGDRFPPGDREVLDAKKGAVQIVRAPAPGDPISLVRLQYRQQKVAGEGAFWLPFKSFGFQWDPGWLLAYIAAYIPAMMFFRWLLRIP